MNFQPWCAEYDQFFAGGEGTNVFVVEIEKETFIFEIIRHYDELWSGLLSSLPTHPIKDHPTLTEHRDSDYENDEEHCGYDVFPQRFLFVSADKVSHVRMSKMYWMVLFLNGE